MTSLNPTYTIGKQLMEAILLHTDRGRKEAYARAVDMLRLVNVNDTGKAYEAVSFRVFGRYEAARHDRYGAGVRAGYPYRR